MNALVVAQGLAVVGVELAWQLHSTDFRHGPGVTGQVDGQFPLADPGKMDVQIELSALRRWQSVCRGPLGRLAHTIALTGERAGGRVDVTAVRTRRDVADKLPA